MTDVARPIRVGPSNGGKNIGTHGANSIGNDAAATTWLTTLRDKYGHCCLCRPIMNRALWQKCLHRPELPRHVAQARSAAMIATPARAANRSVTAEP